MMSYNEAVYTYDSAYESLYNLYYDFIHKVSSNNLFTKKFLLCKDTQL
jgi:hypothetical protein